MKYLVLVVLFTVLLNYTRARVPLVVLGIDGYGYQHYQKYGTGPPAVPLKPVYPTYTLPNLYSIATGLFPTQHGIIGNVFWNRKQNATFRFSPGQHEEFDWFKGEPIWVTAKKAGLRLYLDGWIGSAAEFGCSKPDFLRPFKREPFSNKITDLLENIANETTRCDLYMIYEPEPDSTLHKTDISNEDGKLEKIFNKTDQQILNLTRTLDGMLEYNLIVLSDHGILPLTHTYSLSKDVTDKAHMVIGGPTLTWYNEDTLDVDKSLGEIKEQIAYNGLSDVFLVSKTCDFPKRFEMCGMEEEGLPDIMVLSQHSTSLNQVPPHLRSHHGYDNEDMTMFGHMRVHGPGFRDTWSSDNAGIYNTELYNLFCTLIGVTPHQNTGSLDTFSFLLAASQDRDSSEEDGYTRVPRPCDSGARLGGLSHFFLGLMLRLL